MEFYQIIMTATFLIGYLLIVLEHKCRIDKATSALMMAVIAWSLLYMGQGSPKEGKDDFLGHHLGGVSQVIFFLVGALTIVETISAHGGFAILARSIQFKSKKLTLWVLCLITFFFSAIIGSLTITIVMVSILLKVVKERQDQLLMGSAIVISANAGGVWAPIGDLTTTMLWVGGQVSAAQVMQNLILPSIACMVGALVCMMGQIKGNIAIDESGGLAEPQPGGTLVFVLGVILLLSVPLFQILTGLPPFMGILWALSVMWIVTDLLHRNYSERAYLKVNSHFANIDMSAVMFFLGILLAIDALYVAGILERLANFFTRLFVYEWLIACIIGLASAVVDNVPLVAACQGMYALSAYPMDHPFWQMIAYCAGTGGSVLIIGSASGIAFMSLSKATFSWYLKHSSLPALVGYLAGFIVYLLLNSGIFF
ncbi:MAG: hypothetical protein K0S07_1745 [Chlamydiales bacterium]|jgi:Na+/H+ antiporter NhaD/arsenite permease-like protein|nr:hypothetical protein [Chlamydiales bacterium]